MLPRFILLLVASVFMFQGGPGGPPPGAPGPWDNDVLVYRADKDGRVEQIATFPRAGVPTLARLSDGRVMAAHQHFPENDAAGFDKVAVHFSSDEGRTWTPAVVIHLTGLPDGMRFPFDPTLVPLPDGRIRLYFTSTRQRMDQDLPAIYSAVSTNGVDFTVEPGRRFGIDGRPVIDSAVVLHNGVFHLYAPDNGNQLPGGLGAGQPQPGGSQPGEGTGYHATSLDGVTFAREDDVRIDGRRRWLGGAVSDGTTITFFGTGDPGSQGAPRLGAPIGSTTMPAAPRPIGPQGQARGGIWMATSRDGQRWRLESAPAVPGADPGAVAARDGGWIFAVTGPPRSGTASARGRAGGPQPPNAAGPNAPPPPMDGGPRNHRLILASSKDGMTWTLAGESFAEHASVPALFEGPDGRLITIYVDASGENQPGALGARIQRGDGTWEPRATNLRGADPDVVRLTDGSFRAYTKEPDGSIPVFWSRDGLQWNRLGTSFRDDRYPNATDPDVFETPDGWVMLLSLGPKLLRSSSADGLQFVPGVVADLGGSVSSTVKVTGGWRTYFHVNASPQTAGKMVIRSAFTADGLAWRVDPGDRVVAPASGPARFGVADPAPVRRSDGTWVMLVKSFIEQPGSGR